MRARRAARQLALDVLYESESRSRLPVESLEVRESEGWVIPSDDETATRVALGHETTDVVLSYVRELVGGVQELLAHIDRIIALCAGRWAVVRAPILGRNLVRMPLFELFWGDDVPVAVAIKEALQL